MTFEQIKDYSSKLIELKKEVSSYEENKFFSVIESIDGDLRNKGDLIEMNTVIGCYVEEYASITGYKKKNYAKVETDYFGKLPYLVNDIDEVVDGAFLQAGNLFFHTTPDWDSLDSQDPNPNESYNLHVDYDTWYENRPEDLVSPTEASLINTTEAAVSGGVLATIDAAVDTLNAYVVSLINKMNENTRKTSTDTTSINNAVNFSSGLIQWRADANRLSNVAVLSGLLSVRELFHDLRKVEIVSFMTVGDGADYYSIRNMLIKNRINKQTGTLNNVYRSFLMKDKSDIANNEKVEQLAYYTSLLLVKNILASGDGGFALTVERENNETSYSFSINDDFYIVGDKDVRPLELFSVRKILKGVIDGGVDENGAKLETPTTILDLNKKVSRLYTTDNNIRAVKIL